MNIKTGDYIENLRGIVGVVNTVGRPAENENGKRFVFDWNILYPEKMPGNRGFFEGDESALWMQFKRVGTYENPFLKDRMGKKPIEPFELTQRRTFRSFHRRSTKRSTEEATMNKKTQKAVAAVTLFLVIFLPMALMLRLV